MMPTATRTVVSLVLATLSMGSARAANVTGTWEARASMAIPRQEVGAARIGDTVYVVGGLLAGFPIEATASVEQYDIPADSWSFAPNLPVALDHMGVAALNDVLYVVGGYSGDFQARAEVWLFDPAVPGWTAGTPMPVARGALWVVAHQGRLFAFGGTSSSGAATRSTWIYDPIEDEWTPGTDMPTTREHLNAVSVGDYIYVLGGRAGASSNANERYDPENDTWLSLAPMPTARSAMAAAAFGARIHAAGGEIPVLYAVHEVYDIAADTWCTAPSMPLPRHGVAAVTLDDIILMPAGGIVQGLLPTDVVDAFRPDPPIAVDDVAVAGTRHLAITSAHPNPFRQHTAIEIAVPRSAWTEVIVFDVLGRRRGVLLQRALAAGRHRVAWDGTLDGGATRLPSGSYVLRMESAGGTHVRKVVRLD